MEKMKEDKHNLLGIKILIFALVLVVVAGMVWLLTNKKETVVNSDYKGHNFDSLECRSETLADDFEPVISPGEAERSEYALKLLFDDDELSNISYEFSGIYASDKAAEGAEAWFRTDYNKYMGENGINAESLNPVFMNTDNNLKISLYAERKNFTSSVVPIFLIDREEYGMLSDLSLNNLKKLYENKGFSCVAKQ